ncbi:MAG: hypothetical protein R6U44_10080 [Archaeoglobaceae archaeon]
MKVKQYVKIIIFLFLLAAVVFGLWLYDISFSSIPKLVLFIAFIFAFPLLALKYPERVASKYVIVSFFMVGVFVLLSLQFTDIPYAIEGPLKILNYALLPAFVATSYLIRVVRPSSGEVVAFFIWVLVSVGIAILFNLPTGHELPYPRLGIGSVLSPLAVYSVSTVIPIAFCLAYRRAETFLIFVPMPVVLGYLFYFMR